VGHSQSAEAINGLFKAQNRVPPDHSRLRLAGLIARGATISPNFPLISLNQSVSPLCGPLVNTAQKNFTGWNRRRRC
jgi:hypothetical protein